MARAAEPETTRRAAQYLRMSTDQQRYSLDNQAAAIAAYAAGNGLTICRSYVDAGVSGLRAANRHGMQQLLAEVVGGEADFEVVLVYDVSRWGRFQNPDEAAHYEFVCRQEGVQIEYCAEELGAGGVAGALLKQVKRVMAAEYSRHLSVSVLEAQRRAAAQGYWQGGPTGYGLRRCVVDFEGRPVAVLQRGEQKAVHGHRVVLVPGPDDEVAVVRRIYRLFLEEGVSRTELVRLLNREGVPYGDGRPWSFQRVINVLTNPLYAGDQVFGRHAHTLGASPIAKPRHEWITAKNVVAPSVSQADQAKAAKIIAARMVMLGDKAMLERLAALLKKKGRLSADLIDAARMVPCAASYRNRFGSLHTAYQAIGYDYVAAVNAGRARAAAARRSAR